jgi:hypothetical protein
MEEQERRIENPLNGAHDPPNGATPEGQADATAETQVGSVKPGLARVTRQLPISAPAQSTRRAEIRAAQAATRERIAALVAALGDRPTHFTRAPWTTWSRSASSRCRR